MKRPDKDLTIGVFVCANGLGHIRRVVAILHYLLAVYLNNRTNVSVRLHLPSRRIGHLNHWDEMRFLLNSGTVSIHDFTYPEDFQVESLLSKRWDRIDLPSTDGFDLIWSDNITQILDSNCPVILTGSFFWYEVLDHLGNSDRFAAFIRQQRDLVIRRRPVMIGNEYFSTPDVRQLTDFHPVGLYKYHLVQNHVNDKQDILLSAGLGGESLDACREAVKQIIRNNLKPPRTLFLEPRIYEPGFPGWIRPASYENTMFSQCYAACIRPGIGTVSDALLGGNYIFSFHEGTPEMNHNSSVLELHGFGEEAADPFEAYNRALALCHDKEKIRLARLRTAHLRSDGVSASAMKIQEIIQNL